MTPEEDFCKELVLSLPPMESRDFATLKENLKTVKGFKEDFFEEIATRTCIVPGEAGSNPLVDALQDELREMQEHYRAKHVSSRFTICLDDENNLVIRTYAEQLDAHNWATGYWATIWNLTRTGELSGKASVHVYSFEDSSNVQMRGSRVFTSVNIPHEHHAKGVVKKIAEYEKALLEDLSDEDAVMSSLKQIRRILPITRTRMKWDASAQNQVRLLNARKTA
jgi:hypothetical protein